MNVTLQIVLPFHSFTFRNSYDDCLVKVNFRGTEFKLAAADFDEEKNSMLADVKWVQEHLTFADIDESQKNRLAEKGIDFLNFIIYHARTFDLATTNMVLVSPRTVRTVVLILESGSQESTFEIKLINEPPEFFREYFEYLNEPGSFDAFYDIVQESQHGAIQLLEINLLCRCVSCNI